METASFGSGGLCRLKSIAWLQNPVVNTGFFWEKGCWAWWDTDQMHNKVAVGVGWVLVEHIYAEMQCSFQMGQGKSGRGHWESRHADYIF